MRRSHLLLPSLLLVAATAIAAEPAAPLPARMTAAECEVWARELSFARSVADHDAKAFADHVGAGAAFAASSPQPQRGRQAIVEAWAGIVDGSKVHLEWYPTRTTLADAADVAWSSGPALIEQLDPAAKQRYLMTQFRSVWHKDADGIWRVLFDDGSDPRPATEAEAAAFHAGRKPECPQA
jgi:ketosteroid isomerase-like protein